MTSLEARGLLNCLLQFLGFKDLPSYTCHQQWPKSSASISEEVGIKPLFCGLNQAQANSPKSDLIAETVENLPLDSGDETKPPETQAELYLLHSSQMEDFPEEYKLLKDGHEFP